jgi:hypothetical protein
MNNKTFNIILGSIAVLGLGTGLFFIFRKPKLEREMEKEEKDKKDGSGGDGDNKGVENKDVGKTACGQTLDFTLPIQKSPPSQPSTKKNSRGNSYLLGQNVIVLDGSNIQRMDSYGCQQGSVKIGSGYISSMGGTALGSIYYINKEQASGGQTVVIKAKSGFSYPFYLVTINNLK